MGLLVYNVFMSKYRTYKGVKVNSFGIPIFNISKKIKKTNKKPYHHSFSSSLGENAPKDLIVMYDIPHEKKKERDWFRRHLKKFNYVMIQKSVWVGPSPLPKDFLEYVTSIGLKKKLKTLKLAKSYNGEDDF